MNEEKILEELILLRNLDQITRRFIVDSTDTPSRMAAIQLFEQLDHLRDDMQEFPEQIYLDLFIRLERRRIIGLQNYMQRLQDSNLNVHQWFEEAIAETLDQAVYLQAAMNTLAKEK